MVSPWFDMVLHGLIMFDDVLYALIEMFYEKILGD